MGKMKAKKEQRFSKQTNNKEREEAENREKMK